MRPPAVTLAPVDLADVPRRLAHLLSGAPSDVPVTFHPVPRAPAAAMTAAVDGSSAKLLDGGSFLVAAYRAAAVLAPPGATPQPLPGVTRVRVLHEETATRTVEEVLAALGYAAPLGQRLTPEAALDALRSLEELATARALVPQLEAGALLLLDGAVACRPPTLPQALVEAFLQEAADRGVTVAGLCKSTSMTLGGVPALAHLRRRAYRECPHPTWAVPLPRTQRTLLAHPWAVRLSPAARHVFRVDVTPHASDALPVIAQVAAACTHPGYAGYPYPLALAHNAAALDERTQEDLTHTVARVARDAGVDEDAWEAAFHDYHEDLERGL
ncbi:MAG TPA: hypothetical protein VNZ52_14895 [Candidatus Thermoplasmatota archaeon]|nr:hypothetical protein [Candidatus Thermoplasmatota archaeon]